MGLPHIRRRYAAKAEELRTIAEADCSPERADALLRIADDYDRMAKVADAIERTYKRDHLN